MSQTRKKRVLDEIRRKRQRQTTLTIVLVAALIALIAGSAHFLSRNGGSSGGNNNGFLFPCLGSEGTAFHIHPWLRIWIDGANPSNITIPAAIGIRNPVFQGGFAGGGPSSCFEPLHTHDSSGIIHVESPDSVTQYTLGDFFQIWNETYSTISINGISQPIVLTSNDILGYKPDQTHTLSLIVDGSSSSAYQNLVLNNYDYCNSQTNGPPCSPTAVINPYPPSYPYGTLHTILVYYRTV